MNPSWPTDLPDFVLEDGFSQSMPDGRLSTDMDVGIPKVRPRFSHVGTPMTFRVWMDEGEVSRFNRFWSDDIKRGAIPFVISDPIHNGQPLTDMDGLPLTDVNGSILTVVAKVTVMIGKETPVISPAGVNLYFVTFPVIRLP